MPDLPANQAVSWVDRLRARLAPRIVGMVLALLAEAFLLLLLLLLGQSGSGDKPRSTVVDFAAHDASDDTPEPEPEPSRAPAPQAAPSVAVRPPPPQAQPVPVEVVPTSSPAPFIPVPRLPTLPTAPPAPRAAPPAPEGPAYGPPDTGGGASAAAYGDTARVGTAPNGQPLYAAAWYRKPADNELRGYLSTASGPGWGLIACKTVPDFRVEDCVGLDEYPEGSQILRAVLAAAWQFRVRPPRRGGEVLVGSWVRIRIDYDIRKE